MSRKKIGVCLLLCLLPLPLLAAPEQLAVLPKPPGASVPAESVPVEPKPVNSTADTAAPVTAPSGAVAIGESADEAALRIWNSLLRRTGVVELAGVAVLDVPEGFVYLGPDETEVVLTDIWGNSPSSKKTLGMIFPQDRTPLDDNAWAVTLDYEEEGYVSDEDADSIDYTDMLAEMKSAAVAESEDRLDQGYEAIELVGWAEPPRYDKATHTLYWAKEVAFAENAENTLNYNIRVLGRNGVLVMNFVAGMHQLPDIRANLQPVLAMASFKDGYRYDQFDPQRDKMAEYGLGGLITGKLLVEVGLIAAALLLLKKFGVLFLLPLWLVIRKKLRSKKNAIPTPTPTPTSNDR